MTEDDSTKNSDDSDLGGHASWYTEIFPAGENDGFYQKFGDHSACFVERSPDQLVVTFDNLSDAGNKRYDREAWAAKFCASNGWSHLGIFSQGPTWYRSERINSFMEGLAHSGFFKKFDRVFLSGTSMGGFAALTYCRLIPGSTVLAFSPQTTLDEEVVPWENRFRKGKAQDWTLPFSDASQGTDVAGKIFVIYDPFLENDKKQVMRLSGENIQHLHGFGLGHKSVVAIRRMDALKEIMKRGVEGTLAPSNFYKLMRGRHGLYLYKLNMEAALRARGQDDRAERFIKSFRRKRRAEMIAQSASDQPESPPK